MTMAAWDIETCPFPAEELAPPHQERLQQEIRYRAQRSDRPSEELSRLARSVHPFLGWVCAIAVAVEDEDGTYAPLTWTAGAPGEETDLLRAFWDGIASFPGGTRWVTFNGKRFDVPFVLARSARYGIVPTRRDIQDTYPYSDKPHTDLMNLWPQHYGLEGLCAHLGVETPKSELNGSCVHAAVERGDLDVVAAYCARDAEATLACYRAAQALL